MRPATSNGRQTGDKRAPAPSNLPASSIHAEEIEEEKSKLVERKGSAVALETVTFTLKYPLVSMHEGNSLLAHENMPEQDITGGVGQQTRLAARTSYIELQPTGKD